MGAYDLDTLLEECRCLHGHLCPGQLLGVRMALLGCARIGLTDPRGQERKKLLVWVEIDRCMADAVGAVTGTRLGRRSLKFKDYGKVAASFLNLETGAAVRVVALDEARALADERHPELANKKERQWATYREAADQELFKVERVVITYGEHDLPGSPRRRVTCGQCGEGINDGREISAATGPALCYPCGQGGYYKTLKDS